MFADFSKSQKQKLIFILVIGLALALVAFAFGAGQLLLYRFGPPNVEATAAAVALEATQISIKATAVALDQAASQATPAPDQLTWNGLYIKIVDIHSNAWPLIQAQNQFNDPPQAGRRMMMMTLQVTNVANDEIVQIEESDFELIGTEKVTYDTYSEETRCGVVPDVLDSVLPLGQSINGNICFQVPDQEGGFQLIYDEYTGDFPAFLISLPE